MLPIDDDELFRVERADLRTQLARAIAVRVPEVDVLPLTEVDAKLSFGARSAYPSTPWTRLATDAGWLTTEILHVCCWQDKPEELRVQLSGSNQVGTTLGPRSGTTLGITLIGVWNPRLDRPNRHRDAFTKLVRQSEPPGLLGGLGVRKNRAHQVVVGPLALRESQQFGSCAPETTAGTKLARCFAGVDQDDREVLFEGNSPCELADRENPSGLDGRLETVLCSPVATWSAVRAKPGRRVLALHREPLDLQGKPRPELPVIDASGTLFAESDWRSLERQVSGMTTYASIQRLVVDNIKALRAPLSRCTVGLSNDTRKNAVPALADRPASANSVPATGFSGGGPIVGDLRSSSLHAGRAEQSSSLAHNQESGRLLPHPPSLRLQLR